MFIRNNVYDIYIRFQHKYRIDVRYHVYITKSPAAGLLYGGSHTEKVKCARNWRSIFLKEEKHYFCSEGEGARPYDRNPLLVWKLDVKDYGSRVAHHALFAFDNVGRWCGTSTASGGGSMRCDHRLSPAKISSPAPAPAYRAVARCVAKSTATGRLF